MPLKAAWLASAYRRRRNPRGREPRGGLRFLLCGAKVDIALQYRLRNTWVRVMGDRQCRLPLGEKWLR